MVAELEEGSTFPDLQSNICTPQQRVLTLHFLKKTKTRDFPGWPVANAPNEGGLGSNPYWRTIPHMLQLTILYATKKTEDPVCHN